MKIYRIGKKDLRRKMDDWFKKRTEKHISLVEKYCNKAIEFNSEFSELKDRIKTHDQTKFKEPELDPYVYITWKYKCEDDGKDFEECNPPENMEDLMHEATLHHIKNNRHHPEYHSNKVSLNKDNRDEIPDEMVDASKMTNLDIAEMVCDWCAVSEERGNTPKSWADKNVNKRWKFTDDQKDLIYEIIKEIW